MYKIFLSKYLPLMLLGGLFITALITISLEAKNYGVTMDESSQEAYAQSVVAWYRTFGKDQSFLQVGPDMLAHGPVVDVAITLIQKLFPTQDHWTVRHVVTALTGLAGVLAIALCGYELGGFWAAFLAALALWLYPRYYGAIYNNSKDIPAATTMAFALWAVLRLIKQWSQKKYLFRYSLLAGFLIGLAASIRITALVWFPILGLIVGAWWLLNGRRTWQEQKVYPELLQQSLAASMIGITSLLTMMALWPYIFLSPIKNSYRSIKIMSQYPWNGTVLYNGKIILATQLPRTYAPKWLLIGSPPMLLLLVALGMAIACGLYIKRRRIDPKIAVVILAFIVPLAVIVGLHSVLYDTIRQILFLVPPMILIAVYGFICTLNYLGSKPQKTLRWAAAGLAVLTLASYLQVINDMLDLYPFEYSYFSPLVGGISGANGLYDTDYWVSCSEQAAQWLSQNYQRYTSSATPTMNGLPYQYQFTAFLPSSFQQNTTQPDFYIGSARDGHFHDYPNYVVIHYVTADNVPVCVIKANPALLGQR